MDIGMYKTNFNKRERSRFWQIETFKKYVVERFLDADICIALRVNKYL